MANILVLGDGRLGSEIVKQTGCQYISRKKDCFDVRTYISHAEEFWRHAFFPTISEYNIDTILNCIAYTNTYEDNYSEHKSINTIFPSCLAQYCFLYNIKLVHISTDYVYAGSVHNAKETDLPVPAKNWYSYTKLLGDEFVMAFSGKNLIIRTSFKPKPFPYKQAIMTQMGNFDYVDVIAGLIIQLINKGADGIYNVGTKKKTIFDLAKQTVPNIMPSNELIHPSMPIDITMNIEKMKEFLK